MTPLFDATRVRFTKKIIKFATSNFNPTKWVYTMKKLYKLLLMALALTLPPLLHASTYNTIVIDGANNGWAADETFDSISHNGNPNPRHAYFTWDADYIYIGIMDDEAAYTNLATFVYFDTDPWGTNGSNSAYAWGGSTAFITTPFKSDYVVIWKNKFGDDYIEVRNYNNATGDWDYQTSNSNTFVLNGSDTVVKFAIGSQYREVKIKRSLIGNPDAIKTCMFTEQQYGSNHRYMTWPSEGWTDADRAPGQTIPNYYGFLLEENYALDSSAYYDAAFSKWNGNSDNNWSTAANWDNGVPADTSLVIIPSASAVTVDVATAELFDLSLKTGAALTLPASGALTVNGGLFNHAGAAGITVQSTATGNGSLIVKGYAGDSVTAQCYVTAAHWHSFATAVSGQTTSDLFLNHSPDVWLLQYNETTNDYTYISSLTQDLGDMQGWMLWLGGNTDHTFTFAGPLRSGTLGSDNNMIRTSDTTGYNFVGNPFTSAIDWDTSGWTKTNLNNAIYVYNHNGTTSHWATYVNGAGVDGGSRYIAMNQGFFVQVANGSGAYPEYGTLKMTKDVCVHNNVQFFKNSQDVKEVGEIIRLQVTQDSLSDETVIRIHPQATAGFDGEWDAHKLTSFGDNNLAIFSSANGGMAINSVPPGTETIPIDFAGPNAAQMTVSLTECDHFDHVFLTDNSQNITVDLKEEPYTFVYRNYIHNRFYIHFTLTGEKEQPQVSGFDVFAVHHKINIINNNGAEPVSVTVYNLLGQKISSGNYRERYIALPTTGNRYYVVQISGKNTSFTRKVFVP